MQPPEFFLAISLLVILPIVMTWMILRYKRERSPGGAGGAGITESELKALMREAVDEAIDPLMHRMEALERLQVLHHTEAPPEELPASAGKPRELN